MVLVFGATGFTGQLVVSRLVDRGLPVRIAGRSEAKLKALSDKHGGLDWAVADVEDPPSLDAACAGVQVLVSTVGPYSWWGHVAVEAAIRNRVAYIDITGEPAFVRRIFEEWGPQAEAAGVPLLTAFGYDYIPGNLAGALALEEAGDAARAVDVGYFVEGSGKRSPKNFSLGTLKSLRASSAATQFAFRDGRIIDERSAKHVFAFEVGGKKRTAVSIGSSEHLALPRSFPQLEDVNVGLGWFAEASRAISVLGAVTDAAGKLAPVKKLMDAAARPGKSQHKSSSADKAPVGPSESSQATAQSLVVALTRDAQGKQLSQVVLRGPNAYPLTGGTVAWAAQRIIDGQCNGTGALGPVEAFGLDALREGCGELGLRPV